MGYRKRYQGWASDEPGWKLVIRGRTANGYFRVSENPDPARRDSTDDQEGRYDSWLPQAGCLPGIRYTDDDRSASGLNPGVRREDFIKMQEAIRAGRHDGEIIWFWSTSRQTRGDFPFDDLVRASVGHGIVWCENGRVLNPANHDDLGYLEQQNLQDKAQPRRTSKDVARRKEAAALKGRPAVRPLYGYRREYETDTHGQTLFIGGKPVIKGDVISELDEHGAAVPGTPAAIAREIIARIGRLEKPTTIRDDFENRRIPAPRFPIKCTVCGKPTGKAHACPDGHEIDLCRWSTTTIRDIAGNPGYLGHRSHHVESYRPADRLRYVLPGVTAWWPPLVTQEEWDLAHDALIARTAGQLRGGGRGTRRFLLSTIARCAHCGSPMSGQPGGAKAHPSAIYSCNQRGCVTILADWLDNWAEEILCNWLGSIEVSRRLWSPRDHDDEDVKAARKELAEQNRELEVINAAMDDGTWEGGVLAYGRAVKATTDRIDRCTAIIGRADKQASLALRNLLGPDAVDKWHELKTRDLLAARTVMMEALTIYVRRAPRRGGAIARGVDEDRVVPVWNIGDQARPAPPLLDSGESRAERRQAARRMRETVTGLLLAGPDRADSWIGTEAECDYHLVQRVRAELTRDGRITDPGYRRSATGKRLSVHHGSGAETGPLEDDIEKLVRNREGTRAADVVTALGISTQTAQNNLARLARAGRIRRTEPGLYAD